MTEEQYKELCETCDSLLLSEESTLARVANPWLHVIREHPVFLQNYIDIFDSNKIFSGLKNILYQRINQLLSYNYLLLKAFTKKEPYWFESEYSSQDVDFLFVSHLLNANQAGNENDFYFGRVPNELAQKGHKVIVVLINHSDRSGAELISRWDNKCVPRVILSKISNISEEIAIHHLLKREASCLEKSAKKEAKGIKRNVHSRAAMEALSNSTRSNIRMSNQLTSLFAHFKPANVIITHEGHAWERMAFAVARKERPGVKCIGYQHSVMFRLQHAIKRNLMEEYNPDIILAAGDIGKSQLEKSYKLGNIPVLVLGSDRGFVTGEETTRPADELLQSKMRKKPCCLVIPEGIMSECNLLFEFSLECALECPDFNFIWRLHPLISFKSIMESNPKFKVIPSNVILSENTLEEDINESGWSLYRGTTAIIKGVGSGLRPLYFKIKGELSIDPLFELEKWKIEVESPQDFKAITYKDLEEGNSSSTSDYEFARHYCNRFFHPFNSSLLNNLI